MSRIPTNPLLPSSNYHQLIYNENS